MSRVKTAAIVAMVLVSIVGVAAATGAVGASDDASPATDSAAADGESLRNVDVFATYADGTARLTVTATGEPVENVSVEYEDEVYTTDENGTVAVDVTDEDEFDIELEDGEFEGKVEYVLHDGSMTIVEEEYEYEKPDEEKGDADERDDEERDDREDEKDDDDDEKDDDDERDDDDDERDDDELDDERDDE